MKRIGLSLMLFYIIGFWSCRKDKYETHESNGKIISETFELSPINSLIVDTKCTLILKEGSEQNVNIKISENIINDINLIVNDGVWEIDYKDDGIATYNNHEFTIELTSSNINSIIMESSGHVYTEGFLRQSPLKITHNASGSMQLNCNVEETKIIMDGSGKLTLNGTSQNTEIFHDASGLLKAFGLNSETCNINHDGSGNAELSVNTRLKSHIMGSGDIYYKGNPELISNGDGSGQLINAN